VGEDDFFGLGSGHGFKLPTCLFFEALAIGSLPQFLPLSRLVGYFCRAGLDYEEEEDESNSRRKKPWRYRWPEEIHDEVLARLLDLNQKRHEAEILGGKHAETKAKSKKSRKPKAPKSTQTNVQQPSLFGE
jgi:hypothetical protein